MKKITVSLIQTDIKTGQVKENLLNTARLIEVSSKYKPNFIVMPEMWATGFAYNGLKELAQNHQEEIFSFLKYHAIKNNAIIVGGSIPYIKNERIYNTCFVFNYNGKIIGSYDKIHTFSPFEEDKYFENGKSATPFDTHLAKIGVIICYDLRFPDLSTKLSLEGIQILFIPAQFPLARENHWETLLKARAIENAIFVCGCNRVGSDKKHEYAGISQIIDPWGKILEKGSQHKEEVITATFDLNKTNEAREKIPVYKDRKKIFLQ